MIEFHDTIIVGAGISGLYSAYKIISKTRDADVLILERSGKRGLGGRMGTHEFYGTPVPIGAGIGRKNKDRFLFRLAKTFGLVDGKTSEVRPNFAPTFEPVDFKRIVAHLRQTYTAKHNQTAVTFRQFAEPILGDNLYSRFITTAGYRDYEQEDAYETLFHYGLEDNTCCWRAFRVPWAKLVDALAQFIGESRFKFNCRIDSVQPYTNRLGTGGTAETTYILSIDGQRKKFACRRLIVATAIDTTRRLLGKFTPVYDDIKGQPFLRLYAKFTKQSAEILARTVTGYTVVPGPLQKIIPMDAANGVYMIAYSDNRNATKLAKFGENTEPNRQMYCSLVEIALGLKKNTLRIVAIRDYFWEIGTHYYAPLDKAKYGSREQFIGAAQHPADGIWVVGEAVSRNQGWTEGALESVERAFGHSHIR